MKPTAIFSKYLSLAGVFLLVLFGCEDSQSVTMPAVAFNADQVSSPSDKNWYQPPVTASWYWQLTGELETIPDVDVVNIDLFETSAEKIAELQAAGRHVICYFSAGSWEDGRPDSDDFPDVILGERLDAWPEYWLDIRSGEVQPMMRRRLELAAEKGCDGVEPDNIDGYQNKNGFDLTAEDQLQYNRWLAAEAHGQNLAIGLKNDLDQVTELVKVFDFAINEECYFYEECELLQPFVAAGKPVWIAEYKLSDGKFETACDDATAQGFYLVLYPIDLDGSSRQVC